MKKKVFLFLVAICVLPVLFYWLRNWFVKKMVREHHWQRDHIKPTPESQDDRRTLQ